MALLKSIMNKSTFSVEFYRDHIIMVTGGATWGWRQIGLPSQTSKTCYRHQGNVSSLGKVRGLSRLGFDTQGFHF